MADIQVANSVNLAKIESFLYDSSYKEAIENASSFNLKLCSDRRKRMPFVDLQTGMAQTHGNLFMSRRQRMPGLKEGQLYTYPAQRWKKIRHPYLTVGWSNLHSRIAAHVPVGLDSTLIGDSVIADDSNSANAEALGEDSRDGSQAADPKEWFYEDLAIEDELAGEEPEPESDEDYYDDTYVNRRRRAAKTNRGTRREKRSSKTPSKPGGRKRAPPGMLPYEVTGDPEKPYGCELCGAKYKTRAGLIYHFNHTHKEQPASDGDSRESGNLAKDGALNASALGMPKTEYQDSYVTFLNNPNVAVAAPPPPQSAPLRHYPTARASPPPHLQPRPLLGMEETPHPMPLHHITPVMSGPPPPHMIPPPQQPMMPHHMPPRGPMPHPINQPPQQHPPPIQIAPQIVGPPPPAVVAPPPIAPPPQPKVPPPAPVVTSAPAPAPAPILPKLINDSKDCENKASPSPYCDFCLGDDRENKKTGTPEELVSCSDCGRSGHPTCLQFTANMRISVREYRWQCIECKCCSVCGNSDNDDQLLFCDDCDRGYHMYCLSPPLQTPPEGSWSCALCLTIFHKKK